MGYLRLWRILTNYVVSAMGLTSSILFFVVYLLPGTSSPSRALMTISPNRLVPLPSDPRDGTADGPSIRMNLLREPVHCPTPFCMLNI